MNPRNLFLVNTAPKFFVGSSVGHPLTTSNGSMYYKNAILNENYYIYQFDFKVFKRKRNEINKKKIKILKKYIKIVDMKLKEINL